MKDGYPEKDDLERISKWDIIKDIDGLIEYIKNLWIWEHYFIYNYPDLELHTGGWSGHEDIISALKENTLFWLCYWYMSKRGGHHYFKMDQAKFSIKTK